MSDNHVFMAVKIWAAAAWADGVVVDSEAMTMRAIIQAAKLSEEERTIARGWLDQKVTFEQLELAAIPAAEKLHIYSVACGMVAFDQDVAATEKTFLERLGKALGLSAADVTKARAAAKAE